MLGMNVRGVFFLGESYRFQQFRGKVLMNREVPSLGLQKVAVVDLEGVRTISIR
jgi:hypothetical protein